jgi:hypothetical protein
MFSGPSTLVLSCDFGVIDVKVCTTPVNFHLVRLTLEVINKHVAYKKNERISARAFFNGFCDVTRVAIVYQLIYPNLATS